MSRLSADPLLALNPIGRKLDDRVASPPCVVQRALQFLLSTPQLLEISPQALLTLPQSSALLLDPRAVSITTPVVVHTYRIGR